MNIGELKRLLEESGLEDDTPVLFDSGDYYELWEARMKAYPVRRRHSWFFKYVANDTEGKILTAVVISGP